MKRIVLLYNLNHHNYEYETEFDSQITIDALIKSLESNYEVIPLEVDNHFIWIQTLIKTAPDLVFNICEGYYGPARESVYPAILEQLKIKYTGPDSTNLIVCHNKSMVKKLMQNRIKVPKGVVVHSIDDIDKIKDLIYPVIVKLNSEGSSIGLSKESIVYNKDELLQRVLYLQENYKSNILIEEYIVGKDLSMIYVEGIGPLGPCLVECDAEFYDYEMKTDKDDTVEIMTTDDDYSDLYDIVRTIVNRLDIKGYAKIDFRMNNTGYYLIEVNGQVSFHPLGEFITCAKSSGYDFDYIVNFIAKKAQDDEIRNYSIGIGEEYD